MAETYSNVGLNQYTETMKKYSITYKIAGVEPVSIEEYNTNNAWGFGGSIGIRIYYPNGTVITMGRVCYRHAPSHKFVNVMKDNLTIISSAGMSFNKISQLSAVITAITG